MIEKLKPYNYRGVLRTHNAVAHKLTNKKINEMIKYLNRLIKKSGS